MSRVFLAPTSQPMSQLPSCAQVPCQAPLLLCLRIRHHRLAFVAHLAARGAPRGERVFATVLERVFGAVGIASHILFDWITSFGIMFWIPFSRRRYALDWVFILDPFFTGIVSLTLFAATIFRSRKSNCRRDSRSSLSRACRTRTTPSSAAV